MPRAGEGPIEVVVVDDSPTVRQLVVAILEEAGMRVVGVGANGEEAVQLVERLQPDVLTIDIRMPRLDGLEATRQIMGQTPTPIVIVTGSPARAGSDLTFEALRSGALTVVCLPSVDDREGCAKLVQTVRLMAQVPVVHHWQPRTRDGLAQQPGRAVPLASGVGRRRYRAQIVGIAASTGGPLTLAEVLGRLPAEFRLPIVVVQHIARGFIAGLAEWLDGETPLRVRVANHGDIPARGAVLLAPDDCHLQVSAAGAIELSREPPYKGLRPAANYLFRSLALAYGPRAVGIVLTGMGDDGAEGLHALYRAGGLTVAQNEASCVVYGMPGEAVTHKAVQRVLSPEQIAQTLIDLSEAHQHSGRNAHE